MTEEKIPVPQSFLDQQRKDADRRELVSEWRQYLSAKQQEALDENPYGHFQSRIPVDALKAFTASERDELMSHEQIEHSRLKPLAQARDERRRAFIGAGGSGEDFDASWEFYGRDAHVSDVASENLERARRSSSPY